MTTPQFTVYMLTVLYPLTGKADWPVGAVVVDHQDNTFHYDFFDVEEAQSWREYMEKAENAEQAVEIISRATEGLTLGVVVDEIPSHPQGAKHLLATQIDVIMAVHLNMDIALKAASE